MSKMDNNESFAWFLNLCNPSHSKYFNHYQLHTILRRICATSFMTILFTRGYENFEGIFNIDVLDDNIQKMDDKKIIATLFAKSCCALNETYNYYQYNYDDKMSRSIMERFLISQGESSYDLEKINKDQGILPHSLKIKIDSYFKSLCKEGVYVDSEIIGPIIEYIFNINLDVAYIDNYIPRWVKKNTISLYECYNKDNSKEKTINIVIYSHMEHFDSLIERKYIKNPDFKIYKSDAIPKIKKSYQNNSQILETINSPSFVENPKLSSFDTMKYEYSMTSNSDKNLSENMLLPKSVPIYCFCISSALKELSFVGKFLVINPTLCDIKGCIYFVAKMNNFDVKSFKGNNGTQSAPLYIFKIESENLTDFQKECIDYNPLWYSHCEINIYEFFLTPGSQVKKLSCKPFLSEESIYFNSINGNTIMNGIQKIFIMEVKTNMQLKTLPHINQIADNLLNLYNDNIKYKYN
jgi:hypothetical protein